MICKNPFMRGSLPFGCGQCRPCRIKKRRLWVHRIMLESLQHGDNCFVTLTYDDKNLPSGGTLVPKDFQDWLKRFRKRISPHKIRYFGVGEYGERTQRPHYHAAIFGWPACSRGVVKRGEDCPCQSCRHIRETWQLGHILVGTLTKDSAGYIAGYVTKNLTEADNELNHSYRSNEGILLGHRHPEFARMSKRPGIGAPAIPAIARALDSETGMVHIDREGDVPSVLQHGKKKHPLGRYLKEKLREELKFVEKGCPPESLSRYKEEMRQLFEEGFRDAPFKANEYQKKMYLLEKNKPKILSAESRFKIFNKKGIL